ncbi:GATA-like domain-containing protein [Aspergillus tanneri]|uniref:Nitrogen regulatory protein areA GATA-like domain-containing protein n=1 Tax=Aspergillus tanneri TaxID=1220188 RepID=A0A5M9MXD2_9EURO|nr:uncharacterized protein ATNIH1004_005790 [Aspergillus tanneri]KAA8647107.1 hypothetical protein ATNIH1004_005790 [Aspergillus tanneri]
MKGLPKGLVSTTDDIPTELRDLNAVEIDDIIQLWKVYSANPSVHGGDIGYRLENFFWRIWSSERLRRSINGFALARLFLRITEASPLSLSAPRQTTAKAPEKGSQSSVNQTDNKTPSSTGSSRALPPPILKKSSTSSQVQGESQKTTRLLLTGVGGQSITRKPSTPPTPIPPPSRKKAYFAASKGKSTKRRPAIMRRRSSQTSSGASTRTHSPQRTSTPLTSPSPVKLLEQDESSASEVEEPSMEGSAKLREDKAMDKPAELPVSFLTSLKDIFADKRSPPNRAKSTPPKWGYVTSDDFTHYNVKFLSSENYEQPSSVSLVDKNFRARFAERQRQESEDYSSSPFEAIAPNAVAKGSPSAYMDRPTPSSSRPGPSHVVASTISSGIPIMTPTTSTTSSDGHMDSGGIPLQTPSSVSRRSQLSLLLEESRKQGTESDET